jgi:hypothetical protein
LRRREFVERGIGWRRRGDDGNADWELHGDDYGDRLAGEYYGDDDCGVDGYGLGSRGFLDRLA